MVANSDIQIWQDAVKGINESGNTDLTQEEWAALTVLNGSLSSGDFSSDESQRSYQVLNDSLKNHGSNPALYTHLYNFITLCYKYAAVQPTSTTQETLITPVTSGTPPTPSKNKQSGTVKNILFGADGQFKQTLLKNLKFVIICLFIAAALTGAIYGLNVYTNIPGYVTTLVVGALASITLLRRNQNGKIREKLAFIGAAAAGIYMYTRYGEQISGGSAFVWTFLGVGLILASIGKNKPKLPVWLAEVIPAALCFLAFERLGGAISGFGAKDIVLGQLVSVRYVEAFKIFLLFFLFQSLANNAVAEQCRERVRSLWRNLLFYGMQAVVFLLLLFVSLNPFKLSIFDSIKSELIAFSQPVRAGADVFDANGNKIGSATKTPISSALLCEHVPGYLATAYDFSYKADFDSARITFEYDAGLGVIGDRFQPRIYYFNESDGTLEELSNQEVQADYGKGWSNVSARTAHFSTYILLNKVEQDAWKNTEIRKPPVADPCPCGSSVAVRTDAKNFDVVFVIDESGSMQQNDRNRLRVEAAKQFVDMMEADSKNNRAAIYGFETSARTILNLTTLNDKKAVKNSLNSIHSSGGTNIYTGLQAAVQELEAKNTSAYSPVIILMTDGQDNSTLTNYMPLIDKANAKGITVFAIGLGNDVNADLLKKICDNTGGGVYYYAENSEALPFIFKSAKTAIIDYANDSNGDGISDYHAQLLYDGTLRLSNGSAQFKGAEFLISDKADFDGDGFKNGEELVVTSKIIHGVEQVCVVMKSDPTKKNSVPSDNPNNLFTYSGGDIANDKVADYIMDYNFSTEYFKEAANIYNHDLSIMSLQLAMAAFGLHKEPYGITKANNISCLLSCMEFNDIQPYGYEEPPTENSIAATIARKSLPENTELLVIAIRGGEYKAEWGGNFKVGDGDVHEGFDIAKEKVINDYFDAYIRIHKDSLSGKKVKLWITGYSRGSAVANLLGAHFVDKTKNNGTYSGGAYIDNNNNSLTQVKFSLKRTDIYTYCFATPNVSKKAEFTYENPDYDNIFCIVSPFDPVPRFPFRKWGFRKYGTIISLPNPQNTDYKRLKEKMLEELNKLNSSFVDTVYLIDSFKVHKGNTGTYWDYGDAVIGSSLGIITLNPNAAIAAITAIYDLGQHDGNRKDETMDKYLEHLLNTTLYKIIGSQNDYVNKVESAMIPTMIAIFADGKKPWFDLIGVGILKLNDVVENTLLSSENNDDIATLGPSPIHLKKLLNKCDDCDNVGQLEIWEKYPAVYRFSEGSSWFSNAYDTRTKEIMKEKNLSKKEARKEAIVEAAKEANNNLKAIISGHYPELYLAWLKTVRYNDAAIKAINKQQNQK